MADFVSKSITKSAERKLTTPIDTVANFLALVQDIIDNNPWGCTSYESAGKTVAGVVRGTEYYTGKVLYENAEAKTVGQISDVTDLFSIQYRCERHYTTTEINATIGRTPGYDSSEDSFSYVLKCHGSNGRYRHVCMIHWWSYYELDATLTGIEAWADTVALLV